MAMIFFGIFFAAVASFLYKLIFALSIGAANRTRIA